MQNRKHNQIVFPDHEIDAVRKTMEKSTTHCPSHERKTERPIVDLIEDNVEPHKKSSPRPESLRSYQSRVFLILPLPRGEAAETASSLVPDLLPHLFPTYCSMRILLKTSQSFIEDLTMLFGEFQRIGCSLECLPHIFNQPETFSWRKFFDL